MSDAGSQAYGDTHSRANDTVDDQSFGALLESIYAFFQRRRLVLIGFVLFGLVLGVLKTVTTSPVYMASTSIVIESKESQISGVQVEQAKSIASTTVDGEVQALLSPDLMERVAVEQKLVQDPEFNPYLAARLANVAATDPSKAPPRVSPERELRTTVQVFASHISVRRQGLSFVITITARSENPVKAAKLADAMAAGYLANQLDAKLLSTRQASTWLQQQVDSLKKELEKQSAAVQAERAASGMMSGTGEGSIADQQVRALSAQLSQARADLAAREARFGSSASLGAGAASASEVLSSPVIQSLRQRESEANRKISELSIRFGPAHPQMQSARQEKADIERQIQQETARIVRGNSSELDVARRSVASMQAELNKWTGALAVDTRRASRLQQLEGQAAATQSTYQNYVTRLQQVTDLEKLQRPDARIIAKSSVPSRPSSPVPAFDLALGLILGSFLAICVAAVLEFLQRGLRTPHAVESASGLSCLVSIPALSKREIKELRANSALGPADYITRKPLSVYSEAFRKLRADLMLGATSGKAPQVVLFTSALAGEGKSTTALAFARTMAQAGSSTILIEADLRRPSIAAVAGLEPTMALTDVIMQPSLLKQAVVPDPISTLNILPSLSVGGRTGVDQSLESFKGFIESLRQQYDFIVIDTAPVLAVAETQLMTTCADAVVLVVRWDRATRDAVGLASKAISNPNYQVRASVLNGVNLELQSRYLSGDAASYYNYNKKYYAE